MSHIYKWRDTFKCIPENTFLWWSLTYFQVEFSVKQLLTIKKIRFQICPLIFLRKIVNKQGPILTNAVVMKLLDFPQQPSRLFNPRELTPLSIYWSVSHFGNYLPLRKDLFNRFFYEKSNFHIPLNSGSKEKLLKIKQFISIISKENKYII